MKSRVFTLVLEFDLIIFIRLCYYFYRFEIGYLIYCIRQSKFIIYLFINVKLLEIVVFRVGVICYNSFKEL